MAGLARSASRLDQSLHEPTRFPRWPPSSSLALAVYNLDRRCITMTTPAPSGGCGDLATFNIHHAFPEALVRGMRSSFLRDPEYHHLTQCESLDDARLNLTETDYSEALAESSAMTPASLQKSAIVKVCSCQGWTK
jgi:hypothetical protein